MSSKDGRSFNRLTRTTDTHPDQIADVISHNAKKSLRSFMNISNRVFFCFVLFFKIVFKDKNGVKGTKPIRSVLSTNS